MSEFIKKAREALERAEKDLISLHDNATPDGKAQLAELEIQLSTAWQVLHNVVEMEK